MVCRPAPGSAPARGSSSSFASGRPKRVEPSRSRGALPDRLHDPVVVVALDHLLDLGPDVLVARSDEAARLVSANQLVLRGGYLDPLDAAVVRALADPLAHREHEAAALVHFLHSLTSRNKTWFVAARAPRSCASSEIDIPKTP